MSTPASANGSPLRLSWSRVKEWEECSEKGWLARQGKRAPHADIRVFFPGTVIDRCMRTFLDADTHEPGAMAATVDQILDREERKAAETGDGVVNWRDLGDKGRTRDWCKQAVTKLEPLLAEHVLPYSYQPALRFSVPLTVPYLGQPRQILLVGEMDLLVEHPADKWLKVWDLKGTENNDYWRSTFPQLEFYEIATFIMTQRWPVRSGLLQPMCDHPDPQFNFTAEHHREMLGRIVRVAEQIWAGQHSPKEGTAGCSWCYVKHACPRYARAGSRVPIGISAGRP